MRVGVASLLLLALLACRAAANLDGATLPLCTAALPPEAVVGSAVLDAAGRLSFSPGVQPGAVAVAAYVDSAHTASNFGKLRVATSDSTHIADAVKMTAAGFLEGYLTAGRINDHHHNLKHYFIHQLNASLERPMQWVQTQQDWVAAQVAAHPDDPWWLVTGLLQAQADGMYQGYAAAMAAAAAGAADGAPVEPLLSRSDLLFLNSNGELYDVIDMFDADGAAARLDAMSAEQLYSHVALQGKCSALIKVTADLSDILFGHSTWDSYTAMTRIYKHYELALTQVPGGIAAKSLSFSSYPGEVFSDDDFYLASSGLVVLETTNHIYSFDVLKSLTTASVPSWQRVRAANLLAHNGSSWVGHFRRHNSGTYNNQYMVVDLNRFQPKKHLQPGLLWVVEQLPGVVEAADMTEVLARGYWGSYNVPVSRYIYYLAGYPDLVEAASAKGRQYDQPVRWLQYQVAPRAEIFRRDQGAISSLGDMKRLMRYNDYQHDPLSGGHPYASVCARGDLAAKGAIPKGGYDTKVTSYRMALALESEVVGGPTTQGQPVFEWGNNWPGFEHRGMPDRYDFKFERMAAAQLPIPGWECRAGQRQQQQQQRPAAAAKVPRPLGPASLLQVS